MDSMDMGLESVPRAHFLIHEPFSDTEQWKTKVKNADNDCPTSSIFKSVNSLFFLQRKNSLFFLQRKKKNSRLTYLKKNRYAIEKKIWLICQLDLPTSLQWYNHNWIQGVNKTSTPEITEYAVLFTTKSRPARSPFCRNWFLFIISARQTWLIFQIPSPSQMAIGAMFVISPAIRLLSVACSCSYYFRNDFLPWIWVAILQILPMRPFNTHSKYFANTTSSILFSFIFMKVII